MLHDGGAFHQLFLLQYIISVVPFSILELVRSSLGFKVCLDSIGL